MPNTTEGKRPTMGQPGQKRSGPAHNTQVGNTPPMSSGKRGDFRNVPVYGERGRFDHGQVKGKMQK